jgi:flavin-binding protein dodecin
MPVVKIIELVGSSEKSWEDAVQEALEEASKTVEHIVGIDVLGYKGEVVDNKIVRFKAHVKIAFTVKRQ